MSNPQITVVGDGPILIDGTIHIVYDEWLSQGVGAHG